MDPHCIIFTPHPLQILRSSINTWERGSIAIADNVWQNKGSTCTSGKVPLIGYWKIILLENAPDRMQKLGYNAATHTRLSSVSAYTSQHNFFRSSVSPKHHQGATPNGRIAAEINRRSRMGATHPWTCYNQQGLHTHCTALKQMAHVCMLHKGLPQRYWAYYPAWTSKEQDLSRKIRKTHLRDVSCNLPCIAIARYLVAVFVSCK